MQADALCKSAPPATQQMITRITRPARFSRRGFLHGGMRDVDFRTAGIARQLLDGATVKIARGKIHTPKTAARVKNLINQAELFDQLLPIDIADQPQASNDIAYRDIRGSLAPVHLAHHRIGAHILCRQTPVEPDQRRGNPRILVAQPVHQLHGKCIFKLYVLMPGKYQRGRFRRASAGTQKPVGKLIGLLTHRTVIGNLLSDTPQIFDQHNP